MLDQVIEQRSARSTRAARLGALLVGLSLSGCATEKTLQATPSESPVDANASPNALLLQAEAALQRNQFQQASRYFCAAADASDDETLAEHATEVAFEHHQDAYVLKCAKRWLQLNSSSEQARRLSGFAALRMYRIDEAAENFRVLIDTVFISPQAGFMELAPHWFDEGSRPAVMALMQKLIEGHAGTAEAHYVLGQAALQAENIDLALKSAQRAAEISPYWAPARSLLARVQLAAGKKDDALATARSTLEQDNRPESRLEYAQLQFAAGQEESGIKELRALGESPEVGPIALRSLALIDMDRGDLDAASRRWRGLVQSGRYVYEGVFYLAQIAERRGEVADAIELYSRVGGGDLAVGAQTRAALLKARAGTAADGVAILREFAKAHPEQNLEMVAAEAALHADLGNINQGIAVLDSALTDVPENDTLRVSKALLLERGNRSNEALKEMRALVRDRPNDPTALNMLGYTLVDRTRNFQEGLDLIQRALDLMPDSGAVLDSMGWALHKVKRDSEALPYLQRAQDRARDPEIVVHLGEVLWSLNRKDEARQIWEKSLEIYPDNADLKDLVRKRAANK